MVITLNGTRPIMIIECKKANKDLKDEDFNQLAEYYQNHKESKVAILTNGILYKFTFKTDFFYKFTLKIDFFYSR